MQWTDLIEDPPSVRKVTLELSWAVFFRIAPLVRQPAPATQAGNLMRTSARRILEGPKNFLLTE